jgi:4-hydroxy-tetrahydrodipicolinate synthase
MMSSADRREAPELHVALVTPFDSERRIDEYALAALADRCLSDGASGLVVLGTSGEAMTLTETERALVINLARDACDAHSALLTVGAGTASTRASLDQISRQQEHADALLVPVPYYLCPTDDGVVAHFELILEAAERPVVVYNIPYRTAKTLAPQTLLGLLRMDGVSGVKQCAGGIDDATLELLRERGSRAVFTGDDAYLLPYLALGASGGICVSANLLAAPLVKLVTQNPDAPALSLHRLLVPAVRALFVEPNPAVTKSVLHALGLISTPHVREPLLPASRAATNCALELVQAVLAESQLRDD